MRKRWLFLIILCLFFFVCLIFVFRLSYKNSTLKYLSDDSRQIELLKKLSTSIIQNTIEDENIKIEFNSEFFLNFVNNTAYVTSQRESLHDTIEEYSTKEKDSIKYVISTSFNPKKLLLTISFSTPEDEEAHTNYEVIYKLRKGRHNTIKYKQKNIVKSIE